MEAMRDMRDIWEGFNEADMRQPSKSAKREKTELEDGEYTVQVVTFDYFDSKKGFFYKWGLEVDDGLMKGSYVEKFQSASEVGLQILAQDLMLLLDRLPAMGELYSPDNNSAGSVLPSLLGKRIKLRKTTNKNGYDVFWFNQCIGDGIDAGEDIEPEEKSDKVTADEGEDDIPF